MAAAAAPSTSRLLHHHQTTTGYKRQRQRLRYSANPSPLALRRHSSCRLSPAGALLPDRVTPFSYGGDDESDDHPREECGLVGVVGDPDAASLSYLGLQKLQHRGEEAAGIVAVGGDGKLKSVTGLGLVADVFGDPSRLASLPGPAAIGHVRYSTAGAAASLRSCLGTDPSGLGAPPPRDGRRPPPPPPSVPPRDAAGRLPATAAAALGQIGRDPPPHDGRRLPSLDGLPPRAGRRPRKLPRKPIVTSSRLMLAAKL